jgi:hypothetical protein
MVLIARLKKRQSFVRRTVSVPFYPFETQTASFAGREDDIVLVLHSNRSFLRMSREAAAG